MKIYLRRSASIQPRTSPKYSYEKSMILVLLMFSPVHHVGHDRDALAEVVAVAVDGGVLLHGRLQLGADLGGGNALLAVQDRVHAGDRVLAWM